MKDRVFLYTCPTIKLGLSFDQTASYQISSLQFQKVSPMFFTLLIVTLLVSALVSFIAARAFDTPVNSILNRLIDDTIAGAWARYMKFAIYVVGISGGVRIHALERYIMPQHYPKLEGRLETVKPFELTTERWVLEIYRTIIESLQSIAWMLLVFFVVSLGMYVLVRIAEMRRDSKKQNQ